MQNQTSSLVFLHYLTTVFDNIKDAILLVGIEPKGHYRLLTANSVLFQISGFPADSVGKEVSDIVHPESYKFLVQQYERVIESKKPHEYMAWSNVPVGRRAYEVQMIPVTNTVGEVVQIAVITRDVTKIENMQKELRRLRALVKKTPRKHKD